jgi:hypothetical protein
MGSGLLEAAQLPAAPQYGGRPAELPVDLRGPGDVAISRITATLPRLSSCTRTRGKYPAT